MVKGILKVLRFEVNGLHKAAYLLGFSALLSQLLALVRDRLLAHTFGADRLLDLYYASFRIPDFLLVTLGSLVSISVLIPFILERASAGESKSQSLFQEIFTVFSLAMIFLSGILYFLIPLFSSFLFPGFSGDELSEVIMLSRILLLSPFFFGLSNLFASIIQIHQKFFVYALSPLLYNLGIIAGVVFLYPAFGLPGLVMGVVAGAFLHMVIQVPFLLEHGYEPRLVKVRDWKALKKVMYLSFPRTIALSTGQLVFLVLVSFASLGVPGSIAIFSLAFNLQSAPLSVIGVSYATAAFPTLARHFSRGEKEQFIQQIGIAVRHIIFWTLPVVALLVVLRAQIVRTILGSGNFSWTDTRLSAACLALFALSLVAQSLILLFIRGYYATGNTKRPLFINLIAGIFTIGFTYFLFHSPSLFVENWLAALLKVESVAGSNVLLLSFGYSVGMAFNLFLFWISFRRDFEKFGREVSITFFHSAFASITIAIIAYFMLAFGATYLNLETFLGIFLQGLFAGLVGLVFGVGVLFLLRNQELFETARLLRSRFRNTLVLETNEPHLH